MPGAIAYVMPDAIPRGRLAEVRAGLRPRVEYDLLLEQYPEMHVVAGGAPAAKLDRLKERALEHLSLADRALGARPRHEGFLATGEDVGIPLAVAAWLRRDRRPIAIITHGSYFGSKRFARVMRLLRRMPNVAFLTLSGSLAQTLTAEFGVPPARTIAAGYATDTRFFAPVEAPIEPDLVVGVGTANRDYQVLADAALPIGARLEIAADSAWYRSRVRLDPSCLDGRVTLGSYAYPELRALYARARVVAITMRPGRHACGYSAIAEAMAMGKPVVATWTECPSDFIVDGETGFYVAPGDREGLAARLRLLLEDDDLACRMGAAARLRMEQFSVERYAARISAALPLS